MKADMIVEFDLRDKCAHGRPRNLYGSVGK